MGEGVARGSAAAGAVQGKGRPSCRRGKNILVGKLCEVLLTLTLRPDVARGARDLHRLAKHLGAVERQRRRRELLGKKLNKREAPGCC